MEMKKYRVIYLGYDNSKKIDNTKINFDAAKEIEQFYPGNAAEEYAEDFIFKDYKNEETITVAVKDENNKITRHKVRQEHRVETHSEEL